MKGWILLLYSLTVVIAIGSGQVELSSNLNDGTTCPNQPVMLQCKAYNSSTQNWVFAPFIPDTNPVSFSSGSDVGNPVIRNDEGLMIEAIATEITEVTAIVAQITSTLSFLATSDVDGKTVMCINDAVSEIYNDSLSILVKDTVIFPDDFSCTSIAVNCEQSYVQYRCTWSQVIDSFNFTVSESDSVIVQEMTFQSRNDKNVEFPVACNTSATVTINAFRICNSSTQSLADITHLSANCTAACTGGTDGTPGLNGGAIAGIVIGTIVIVIIIIIIIVTVAISIVKWRETISHAWERVKHLKYDHFEEKFEDSLKDLNQAFKKQAPSCTGTPENLVRILRSYSDDQSEPSIARQKMYTYLSSIVRESSVNINDLEEAEEYEFPYPLKNVINAKFPGNEEFTQTPYPEVTFSHLAECKWPPEVVYPA